MAQRVAFIPGDGIGPEVAEATRRVVDALGLNLEWVECEAGSEVFERTGVALPEATPKTIAEIGVALKGPITTPSGGGYRSVNVALRKALDLYANVRPARSVPGVPSRYEDVDLIVVRENTEGLYSGLEHEVVPGVVESLRVISEKASRRILRFAFETARQQRRRKVTAVHKANILQQSDGLFLNVAHEVAGEFPDIEYDESIVDATAMRLVLDPHPFDVLVMENLFGDILSDLCAGLIGGLGLTPSANVGERCAMFEAVHGSAPDIAGRGVANPTALLLSAGLMLRHLAEPDAADRLERAVYGAIASGEVITRDLGGSASTGQFADAVIAHFS